MEFSRRYSSLADDVQPQEIVLLMGRGCFWKKCSFCDYHQDSGPDSVSIPLNQRVLDQVTGQFGRLTVLNSGSYFELPKATRTAVEKLVLDKGITHLHLETHFRLAERTATFKKEMAEKGVAVHARVGIETFDEDFRERVMVKGMGFGIRPEAIAGIYDECCLLFGMAGQQPEQFETDLAIARQYFKRIYVNIFNDNSTAVRKDTALIEWFVNQWYPQLQTDPQVCVLIENTALGVGD